MRIISPSGSITCRSGCVPASTRRASPRSAPANANAAARLPTPAGPWRRYACAAPSCERRVEQALRSGLRGASLTRNAHDGAPPATPRCDLVHARGAVDDDVALGIPHRELAVGVGRPLLQLQPVALDPIAVAAHPLRSRSRRRERRESSTSGTSPPTAARLSSSTASTPSPRPAPW